MIRLVEVLFINPRGCMALAEALSQISVKSGLEVIHVPRSFSNAIKFRTRTILHS